jgi:16S rRNA (guanine527-N7)-methyltransferase
MDDRLLETLREAQRLGFVGGGPVEQAVDHSMAFVDAIGLDGARLVDLGSGGGLPGLVLAAAFPGASIVLIDRRRKRTDFLELAIRRLRFGHVTVECRDVSALIRDVEHGSTAAFDVVTARGFGPPERTLRAARALMTSSGRIVISEPPTGDRWDPALLDELRLTSVRSGPVRVFHGVPR